MGKIPETERYIAIELIVNYMSHSVNVKESENLALQKNMTINSIIEKRKTHPPTPLVI